MTVRIADDTVELSGLAKMQKLLNARLPTARIGILGSSGRSGKGATNAEVGAAHEFGTSRVPQRSFLRMPLELMMNQALEKSRAFDDDVMKLVVRTGSVLPWMQKIAVVAKDVVLGAFATAGYGRWQAWSKGYSNRTGNILVDTQQLRNSITEEVKQ